MNALPALKKNPLPTLADEIFSGLHDVIAEHPEGASVSVLSDSMGADGLSVRRAMVRLAEDGRADLRRRRVKGGEWVVVPWRYRHPAANGMRYCPGCGKFFVLRPKTRSRHVTSYDNRHCCSRKCSVSWSWTRPGVAKKRSAGIRRKAATPAAKRRQAAHNRRRWSRPGERKRLAAWNRRRWADPVIKAELTRAIALVQRSPKMRALYSALRKKWWRNPKMRRKMVAAMKRSKGTPAARRKFSLLLKARWQDPKLRKKYLAAVRRTAKLRGAKGKKQSRRHIAKRVASTRRTKVARRLTQSNNAATRASAA